MASLVSCSPSARRPSSCIHWTHHHAVERSPAAGPPLTSLAVAQWQCRGGVVGRKQGKKPPLFAPNSSNTAALKTYRCATFALYYRPSFSPGGGHASQTQPLQACRIHAHWRSKGRHATGQATGEFRAGRQRVQVAYRLLLVSQQSVLLDYCSMRHVSLALTAALLTICIVGCTPQQQTRLWGPTRGRGRQKQAVPRSASQASMPHGWAGHVAAPSSRAPLRSQSRGGVPPGGQALALWPTITQHTWWRSATETEIDSTEIFSFFLKSVINQIEGAGCNNQPPPLYCWCALHRYMRWK